MTSKLKLFSFSRHKAQRESVAEPTHTSASSQPTSSRSTSNSSRTSTTMAAPSSNPHVTRPPSYGAPNAAAFSQRSQSPMAAPLGSHPTHLANPFGAAHYQASLMHAAQPPNYAYLANRPAHHNLNAAAPSPTSPGLSVASPSASATAPRPANELEAPSKPQTQLIVGIDFGTTQSGVAFALITENGVKEDIIAEWPGVGTVTRHKIQSTLWYDANSKLLGWGEEKSQAMGANGKTMPGVKTYQYFKLHLDPENSYHAMQAPPPPPEKRAVDMIADYLRELRKASEVHLQKTLGEVFDRERNNIRYFLTVPAIWDDAAKADMRTAAYLAGYIEEEHDSRLNLVTEPEAAAMFCAKSGLLDLRIGDALLIVDCGGGTVDLIAYQVEDTEPFTVSECTEGSGDVCGSVWLNHNFKKTVDRKLSKWGQPKGSRSRQRVTEKCLEDFDKRIKADFRNNNSVWAVDVGIETDCPEAGITDGNMEFSNEEILQCFEDIVHKIIKLVRNQIEGVQLQNKNLQSILLIGGFGASNYLYEQLKDGVPMRYRNKIVRPIDAVSAIVRGAVTAGITERLITSRVARKHYLMATVQPFREGYHPEEYRTPSLDGQDRCRFTRQVLVKKGQRLRVGERVKIPFFRQVPPGATLIYEDNLYVCDTDRCPEYIKDPNIKELVTLTSDLSSKNLETDFERVETPNGAHYRVDFDIWLTLGGSEFVAELVCQGEVMGQCTARFR